MTLEIIQKLLIAFKTNNINYCHWKSNDHLDAVMTGASDLDILLDPIQKDRVAEIISDLGFKEFHAVPEKKYSDIYDYMVMDLTSGKVVHLHAHYKLRFGPMYLMQYTINFEQQVLKGRVFDPAFEIYRSNPSMEYILFLIRESLKLRMRDKFKILARGKRMLSAKRQKEYKWLNENRDKLEVNKILARHFKHHQQIESIISGEFHPKKLIRLKSIFKKTCARTSKHANLTDWLKRNYLDSTRRLTKKWNDFFDIPESYRRINPRSGLVVALIGADGSGKSTISSDLKSTFNSKFDIFPIYFGRGDGKASRARIILNFFKKKKKSASEKTSTKKKKKSNKSFIKKSFKVLEALLIALEKRSNLKRMVSAKTKGMIVLCDRFPQNQLFGYNDGPLLSKYLKAKNPLFRLAANYEKKTYDLANITPPDLLIKLIASPEVVNKRKPGETSFKRLKLKIDGIRSLNFVQPCITVTLDASEPLEQVLRNVKQEIWNNI